MRALIQRVTRASVTIGGAVRGEIGQGFLVLLGITDGDTADDAVYLADKTVKLRVFTDENDKMNRSLADVGGGILVVSQFTLYGDCKKGNRPSFTAAKRPAGRDRRVRRGYEGRPVQRRAGHTMDGHRADAVRERRTSL